MADTLTDFVESLGKPKGFRVGCIFQQEADLLTVQFENVPHYAERVDKFLTVSKSFDDDNLVGFELKGIRHKIDELMRMLKPGHCPEQIDVTIHCQPHINLLLTFYMMDTLENTKSAYQRVYDRARQWDDLLIPSELVH